MAVLATVTNLATCMVVGWFMNKNMGSSLVVNVLQMAKTQGHVKENTVFHTDHGCQYASEVFTK